MFQGLGQLCRLTFSRLSFGAAAGSPAVLSGSCGHRSFPTLLLPEDCFPWECFLSTAVLLRKGNQKQPSPWWGKGGKGSSAECCWGGKGLVLFQRILLHSRVGTLAARRAVLGISCTSPLTSTVKSTRELHLAGAGQHSNTTPSCAAATALLISFNSSKLLLPLILQLFERFNPTTQSSSGEKWQTKPEGRLLSSPAVLSGTASKGFSFPKSSTLKEVVKARADQCCQ